MKCYLHSCDHHRLLKIEKGYEKTKQTKLQTPVLTFIHVSMSLCVRIGYLSIVHICSCRYIGFMKTIFPSFFYFFLFFNTLVLLLAACLFHTRAVRVSLTNYVRFEDHTSHFLFWSKGQHSDVPSLSIKLPHALSQTLQLLEVSFSGT